jgi:hypothetical protein
MRAVMQPGAAQDILLRAYCEGHVQCQGAPSELVEREQRVRLP